MKNIILLALIAITLASCEEQHIPAMDYTYMHYRIVAIDEDGYDLFSTNRPNAINYFDIRYDIYDQSGHPIIIDGSFKEGEGINDVDVIVNMAYGKAVVCRSWKFCVKRDPYINYKIIIKWDKNTTDEITFVDNKPDIAPILKVNGILQNQNSYINHVGIYNNAPALLHVFPSMPKELPAK